MADYALSVLAKGQAIVKEPYQAPEQRRKTPTVMELALRNQSISIPDAQALRVSPLRTVDVNYLGNIAAGSATAKVAVHTGTHGTSALINVVYVQHVETFSLPAKLAANNIFSYQQMFNHLYAMAWKNLKTRQDTSALAFLYANRCQRTAAQLAVPIAAAGGGSWSDVNYAYEVAQSDQKRFAQYAKAFMAARYFGGAYDIVADLQTAKEFEFQMNQGSGNYNNTAFQFGDLGVSTTQDVISSAYSLGSALIMPQGSFAGLCWNEKLNKDGFPNSGRNTVGTLGTIADPAGSGAEADISQYTARYDSSTMGGSAQDVIDQWELTLTIGYVVPPLTTANDSVVHLIGQTS